MRATTAAIYLLAALTLTVFIATPVAAVEGCADVTSCERISEGNIAIGAGLAVGLAGLATGLAQKDIGAAAVGATAEEPGFLGRAILFIAIPETIVIFGVLIAFLLVGKIA